MCLWVPAANTLPPCPYIWGSSELMHHRVGQEQAPPISVSHSQLIIALFLCHRSLLMEELSAAARSFHLERFVMCG